MMGVGDEGTAMKDGKLEMGEEVKRKSTSMCELYRIVGSHFGKTNVDCPTA
jgi:hypothetical protein